MITYNEGVALLHKHHVHPNVIHHCQGASEVAWQLAHQIIEAYPGLHLDPEKVRLTALLHDIGRSRPGIHEHNSVEILKEEGLPELAEIVMHGTLYEIYLLRGEEAPHLLPQTLEQKIVCYADLRFAQEPMTLRERFDDANRRRADVPEIIQALALAEERFFALEAEILAWTRPARSHA